MNILIDSHVILWWLLDSPNLSEKGRELIGNSSNVIVNSAASIWEIRIKEGLGKLVVPKNFSSVLADQGFEELPVLLRHAHGVKELPMHHRDPFDRLLIAQARVEALMLLTHDPIFEKYDVECTVI